MINRSIAIILFLSVFLMTVPGAAFGLSAPDSGSTSSPGRLSCVGIWAKIICVAKRVADAIKVIFRVKKIVDILPHSFPFGGHILTSERACSLKFNEYTIITICTPLTGCWGTPFGPVPISIPLGGRAIRVGEPVPIVPPTASPYGRAIVFPWISDVYRNHSENRVGPWALGLGFTPFPLKNLNDELKGIRIRIPLLPLYDSAPCWTPIFGTYNGICLENFHFECLDSGEFAQNGDPIYKVIRKLGTAP
ncbi:MAG: hypothetical protein Q8R55_01350 [Candidatus Taylorbacteria bacterium]|nr:hypothetical protein [Candidatus Taylorbacteria bacterium]